MLTATFQLSRTCNMDFATIDTLIMQCATGVAPSTMAAIIKVESGGNHLSIGDNTTRSRVTPTPRTIDEAVAIAMTLINQGHNLDLGISQINSANLKTYKVSVKDIFDPCTNITVGSSILSNFYIKSVAKYGQGETSLFHALSAYNTGSFFRGPTYVSKILKAAGSNASIAKVAWKQPTPSTTYAPLRSGRAKYYKVNNSPIMALNFAESLDGKMMPANEIMAIN